MKTLRFLLLSLTLTCACLGAQLTINLGSGPDTGTGDNVRTAFGKVNTNFTYLFGLPASSGSFLVDGTIVVNPNFTNIADVDFDVVNETNVTGTVKTNTITSAKIVDGTIVAADMAAGAVPLNSVGDLAGWDTNSFGTNKWTIEAAMEGERMVRMQNTDADATTPTGFLDFAHNDTGDTDIWYLRGVSDNDATPILDFEIGQTTFILRSGLAAQIGGTLAVGGAVTITNLSTPTNYTAASDDLATHLNGIDAALASADPQTPWAQDINAAAFNLTNLGVINFSNTATPSTPAAGYISLHAMTTQGHTRPMFVDSDGTEITLSRDSVFIARNTSGGSITEGQAVYISGTTGTIPNVGLAKSDSLTTMPAVGLMLETTGNNNYGYVISLGVKSSIDTSVWSEGNQLFVSGTTAGALTNSRPVYPLFAQRVGSVIVDGASGSIWTTIAPFVGGQESGSVNSFYAAGGITYSLSQLYEYNGGTVAGAGTYTHPQTNNVGRVVASGSTATLALGTAPTLYRLVTVHVQNTSGGAQVWTLPSGLTNATWRIDSAQTTWTNASSSLGESRISVVGWGGAWRLWEANNWPPAAAGGVPTQITVADTTDTTTFIGLFEDATGDLGPKTDAGATYNASTGAASFTSVTEGANAVPNATDHLGFFAATTSAQLAGVVNDEQGSGRLVLNNSPVLIGLNIDDDDTGDGVAVAAAAGFVSFTGSGSGADENLTIDLNSTANRIVLSTSSSATNVTFQNMDVRIPVRAYDSTWNGDATAPTRDDVYDKIETLSAGTPAVIDILTENGTWTNRAGAKTVWVHLFGEGGGGGSGRKGAAGTVRCGGGGGGSGGYTHQQFSAAILGATETVTVGTGGLGGAARTTDDTDGAGGNTATNTIFGAWLKASGGAPGGGGTATAGTSGAGGAGEFTGVAGGAASGTGGSGANGTTSTSYAGSGGGAGGGITSADAASSGGNGTASGSSVIPTTIAGGTGGSGGGAGGNGTSAAAGRIQGGGGGGGGASRLSGGPAGLGGNGGGYGAGAGGGGAGLNATTDSGAGGRGGTGVAIIITFF